MQGTHGKERMGVKHHYLTALIIFLALALSYQAAVNNGRNPFVYLDSDSGNIAAYAAARQHPEYFQNDELLNEHRNYQFYQTVHIYLLPLLERIWGNYGTAFHSLLWLHILFQGFGFYLLGHFLTKDKVLAWSFSLMGLINVDIGFSDFWGIFNDPIPRVSFQAFLPYLLLLVFKYREHPRYWGPIMALAAAGLYIHPASAPVWGLAFWLSWLYYLPPSWSRGKRTAVMIALAVLYILIVAPFVINYFTGRQVGPAFPYEQIHGIIASRFMKEYTNLPFGLSQFFTKPTITALFLTSLIGWLYVYQHRIKDENITLILIWSGTLLFVAVLLPMGEYILSRVYRFVPVQFDMVRQVRLFVPLGLLFTMLCLAKIERDFLPSPVHLGILFMTMISLYIISQTPFIKSHPPFPTLVTILAGFLVIVGIWQIFGSRLQAQHLKYILSIALLIYVLLLNHEGYTFAPFRDAWERPGRVTVAERDDLEVLDYLRGKNTRKEGILSLSLDPLTIRYYALSPVVYAWKDGGALGYSNHGKLVAWHEKHQKLKTLTGKFTGSNDPSAGEAYLMLAREMGARYLVAPSRMIAASETVTSRMIIRNETHVLIDTSP